MYKRWRYGVTKQRDHIESKKTLQVKTLQDRSWKTKRNEPDSKGYKVGNVQGMS